VKLGCHESALGFSPGGARDRGEIQLSMAGYGVRLCSILLTSASGAGCCCVDSHGRRHPEGLQSRGSGVEPAQPPTTANPSGLIPHSARARRPRDSRQDAGATGITAQSLRARSVASVRMTRQDDPQKEIVIPTGAKRSGGTCFCRTAGCAGGMARRQSRSLRFHSLHSLRSG
jgi:hypothetical protein